MHAGHPIHAVRGRWADPRIAGILGLTQGVHVRAILVDPCAHVISSADGPVAGDDDLDVVGPAYGRTPQSGSEDDSHGAPSLVAVGSLGLPLSPDAYSDRFAALCKAAGVPKIGVHTVRHTVALLMHEAGVSPASAAKFLGHTLAVHLSVYVVLTDQGADAAGRGLGVALAVAL